MGLIILVFGGIQQLVLDHLGEANDGIYGRAQLARHRSHEFGFSLAHLLSRILHDNQINQYCLALAEHIAQLRLRAELTALQRV